jgi:hypothetical protein
MGCGVMATYTYVISTEHNVYPNLTVYDRLKDGVLSGWKVIPNDGYVMYDTTDNNTELDENGNEIPVTHYYTQANLSPYTNWGNFSWVAVLRSEVDENYIFGLPTKQPEVM